MKEDWTLVISKQINTIDAGGHKIPFVCPLDVVESSLSVWRRVGRSSISVSVRLWRP